MERPTRHEVLKQLSCINASWHEIGDGLRVSYNVLKGLAESTISNQRRLGDIIQNWLDMDDRSGGVPVTWKTIIDVIKGPFVQNIAHAKTIYEYLKQESSVQQNTRSKYVIVSLVPIII